MSFQIWVFIYSVLLTNKISFNFYLLAEYHVLAHRPVHLIINYNGSPKVENKKRLWSFLKVASTNLQSHNVQNSIRFLKKNILFQIEQD